jgi:putative tricarboxylic transport membrane protein
MFNKKAGVWVGLCILLFSLVFFITSFKYDFMTESGPGPAMLPTCVSALLALLSLFYIKDEFQHSIANVLPKKEIMKKFGVIFLSVILSLLFLNNHIGFVVAFAVMLFMQFLLEYRWITSLIMAIGISISLYAIFIVGLKLTFPLNSLGF